MSESCDGAAVPVAAVGAPLSSASCCCTQAARPKIKRKANDGPTRRPRTKLCIVISHQSGKTGCSMAPPLLDELADLAVLPILGRPRQHLIGVQRMQTQEQAPADQRRIEPHRPRRGGI